jgi:hypothetical protein
MIEMIIVGGQSGIDQAALRAARACGLDTGGWAPKNWLTEAGAAPWLADYGLLECWVDGTYAEKYVARRRMCVNDCHAAILMGDQDSPGSRGLLKDARQRDKPVLPVIPGTTTPGDVIEFIRDESLMRGKPIRLLIAGNRESSHPGIGAKAEAFLSRVFKEFMIPHEQAPDADGSLGGRTRGQAR